MNVDANGWLHHVPSDFKVIELGGGDSPQFLPNVDTRPGPAVSFTASFDQPLPITSNEWDVVFSRYAFEHVSWRNLPNFVAEIHRILKPGGTAVIITANAEAQMRWALRQPHWDERIAQCLGGDQDYPDNVHKSFLNPAYAHELFADFSPVLVYGHGALNTDLVIEAVRR